jgi:hypothetical protein
MRRFAHWVAVIAVLLPAGVLPAAGEDADGEPEIKLDKFAQLILDRYILAMNDHDRNTFYQIHHFPIMELRGGKVVLIPTRAAVPGEVFDFLPVGWFKSKFMEQRVVQAGLNKAHVVARIADLNRAGETLGEYDLLFILTRRGGKWGIQVRSIYPTQLPEGTVRAPF